MPHEMAGLLPFQRFGQPGDNCPQQAVPGSEPQLVVVNPGLPRAVRKVPDAFVELSDPGDGGGGDEKLSRLIALGHPDELDLRVRDGPGLEPLGFDSSAVGYLRVRRHLDSVEDLLERQHSFSGQTLDVGRRQPAGIHGTLGDFVGPCIGGVVDAVEGPGLVE